MRPWRRNYSSVFGKKWFRRSRQTKAEGSFGLWDFWFNEESPQCQLNFNCNKLQTVNWGFDGGNQKRVLGNQNLENWGQSKLLALSGSLVLQGLQYNIRTWYFCVDLLLSQNYRTLGWSAGRRNRSSRFVEKRVWNWTKNEHFFKLWF